MNRILIAEDEEILRMLIVDTLEEEEYIVDEAEDGEEALKLIEENDYDLLILDYMMPGLTGLEVIQKLRGEEYQSNVKILMLSAKSQKHEIDRVLEAGADFFMEKPFSPFQLIERVEEILHEQA
ncbi:response regulator [Cytobacillus spongiae]|jgi:DNA-binding response OmpR family regulator|uniref:response regulator transcription factor n=1 Tax=Cytobacillus spongiae TaxID=2901381 RepID=UPI001F3FEE63|nr:response regulator [Cytobacillus spongiae]UII56747.1 response regulator [Cytobacillus spongiae]